MEDLPSQFDVIVVGTGLAESIVSAAVSRNGHSVLHLDPRDYYGGKWTTINWETLQSGTFAKNPLGNDELVVDYGDLVWRNPIRLAEQHWYTESDDTRTDLSKLSRKFNIDVLPKVLLARDGLIQLLIESNVSRYLEFKCITKLMTSLPAPQENIIQSIPLSRSDIFTTKSLSLVEKRKLTKFIESILTIEPEKTEQATASSTEFSSNKTFDELVRSANINEKTRHLIENAVRTVEDGFKDSGSFNSQFVERCRLFLQSIGRYGNQTPYLWTLYGIGEICQAFCRLSAIYGGIFILKRSIQEVSPAKESDDEIVIKSDESEIKAKYLVLGSEIQRREDSCGTGKTKSVVRGILLTNESMMNKELRERGDKTSGSQMTVYKIGDAEVIELDHSSVAVPKPYYLVHVTYPVRQDDLHSSPRDIVELTLQPFLDFTGSTHQSTSTREEEIHGESNTGGESPSPDAVDGDENRVREKCVESSSGSSSKPLVLHGSYFLIDFHEEKGPIVEEEESGTAAPKSNISSKILYCATGSTEITEEIKKAREVFSRMYPQEDFLPPASDGSDDVDTANELLEDTDVDESIVGSNNENGDPTLPSPPPTTLNS